MVLCWKRPFTANIKITKGETIVETVCAVSVNSAKRIVMLKHPLAEFLDDPSEKPFQEESVSGVSSAVKWRANKLEVVLLSGCIILLAVVALLVCKVNQSHDDTECVMEEKVNTISEGQYAHAYRHIVSIRTEDMAGSGFKLKVGKKIYLYTCFHCICQAEEVTVKDSDDKILKLGELELCYERDLVRFELPEETEGFEIAHKEELKVNQEVVAYGDTLGGGVMTQNRGKILAIGNHKLEIDAAVLCGNSGGPVLNAAGRVLGVVSSGSFDDTIWSKDTRYEKVRKFAERADGGEWELVAYDDFRDVYAFLWNVKVMTDELREFSKDTSGLRFSQRLSRPFAYDNLYKGEGGFGANIKALYGAWNDMVDVEDERQKLWNRTNGKVGTRTEENQYYEVVRRRNNLLRRACVNIPLEILQYADEELNAIDTSYFTKLRRALIKDIETILIPAFESENEFSDRLDKQARDAYEHDYKKAR